VGYYHGFADFVYYPTYSVLFNEKHMSLKIQGGVVNIGTYHDNSKEYHINAKDNSVADILRQLETDELPEQHDRYETAEEIDSEPILAIPQKNKYTQVRKYIKERSRFDAEFKTFVQERSLRDLCDRLTKEFGWFVDEHSLGSNLNRHRKE
jgi:hypothetical protein